MADKVLVVEDEPSIADNIIYALSTDGYDPHWCPTGGEARKVLSSGKVVLVILDVGLPDVNGFDLAREILNKYDVPIIFVTARTDEIDRVVGLEIGGDDYIVKPFSPRELTARVKAVLRRVKRESPGPDKNGLSSSSVFALDRLKHSINYHGKPLELSRYEFRLLEILISHPGRVYTREQLMQLAWEEPEMSLDRTVDTHIKTIRQKLKAVCADEDPIVTHRGIGYSLKEDL